ncbi:MAG TPA: hypothetical protein VGF53_09280 [Pseudolabrys sp.]|jgi:hypothetical protein
MTTAANQYRNLASDLHSRARNELSPHLKAEWDHLADCYERLAEQAEKNARIDAGSEPVLRGR